MSASPYARPIWLLGASDPETATVEQLLTAANSLPSPVGRRSLEGTPSGRLCMMPTSNRE